MSLPEAPDPDLLFWRLTTLLCGVGFGALAAFVAMPDLDVRASALFFDGAGFPLRFDPALAALRLVYKIAFIGFCAVAAAMVLVRLFERDGWRTPMRLWAFFCALMAAGPGLVANAVLKEHWGRARPEAVDAFGGSAPLTAPFAFGEACVSNCSFVSGEGSAAAALAFGLLAVFWPTLQRAWAREAALAATVVWLLGAALIRIAPGKHFLSDTIFAFVLMGLTAAALYRAFAVGRLRRDMTARNALSDIARACLLVRAAWARGAHAAIHFGARGLLAMRVRVTAQAMNLTLRKRL